MQRMTNRRLWELGVKETKELLLKMRKNVPLLEKTQTKILSFQINYSIVKVNFVTLNDFTKKHKSIKKLLFAIISLFNNVSLIESSRFRKVILARI